MVLYAPYMLPFLFGRQRSSRLTLELEHLPQHFHLSGLQKKNWSEGPTILPKNRENKNDGLLADV